MKNFVRIFAVVVPNLLAAPVWAEKPVTLGGDHRAGEAAGDKVVYQARTRYDFDDDLVEGDMVRPEEMIVGVTKHHKHPSLIRIREHFVPEMVKSTEDN